jgi:hypothetical protein
LLRWLLRFIGRRSHPTAIRIFWHLVTYRLPLYHLFTGNTRAWGFFPRGSSLPLRVRKTTTTHFADLFERRTRLFSLALLHLAQFPLLESWSNGVRGAPRFVLRSRGHNASWGNSTDVKRESLNSGRSAERDGRGQAKIRAWSVGLTCRRQSKVMPSTQRGLLLLFMMKLDSFCVHDNGWCCYRPSEPRGI